MGIEFWFHVLDQDGDGVISMYDLEVFYSEQVKFLLRENIDPVINMVKYWNSDTENSDPKPDEVETPWEQFAQEAYKRLLEEGDDEDSSMYESSRVYGDDLML